MRRFVYAALAMMAMITGMAPVQAAPITVITDSGNLGEFTFTNTGIISGTASIAVSAPSILSTINTVNGAVIPAEPVKVTTPVTMMVTQTSPGIYSVSLPPGTTKTVGAVPGSQAIMAFNLLVGETPLALPNFFNASGPITSLIANANPLYDFSMFSNGLAKINFTFTATSFTGTGSFAGLFSTVGATAIGNGSFSQVTVPEPGSVVMMSFGMMGLMGLVRYRKLTR